MSNKKMQQKESSNRKILESALVTFGTYGYQAATLSEIAKRAGFTKGLITQRFGSKEGLFQMVLEDQLGKFHDLVKNCGTLEDVFLSVREDAIRMADEKNPSLQYAFMLCDKERAIPQSSQETLQSAYAASSISPMMKRYLLTQNMDPESDYDYFILQLRQRVGRAISYSEPDIGTGAPVKKEGKQKKIGTDAPADTAADTTQSEAPSRITRLSGNEQVTDARARMISNLTRDYLLILSVQLNGAGGEVLEDYACDEMMLHALPGWGETENFRERLAIMESNLVVPEDRSSFYAQTRRNTILKSLERNGLYFVGFRGRIDDTDYYFETKYVPETDVNGNITGFTVGLYHVESSLLTNVKAVSQGRKAMEMLNVLSGHYDFICYVLTTTNEVEIYRADDYFSCYQPYMNNGSVRIPTAVFDELMRGLIPPEELQAFLRAVNRDLLTQRMNFGEPVSIDQNIVGKEGTEWHRMTFALDQRTGNVVIGARSIQPEIDAADERIRSSAITASLASEYSCVFYYDMETDRMKTYALNERVAKLFPGGFDGRNYRDSIRDFVAVAICKEDRERIQKRTTLTNLVSELLSAGSISLEYRNEMGKYCEFKATYIGTGRKGIVLGVADKDESIRRRMETELELRKNYNIIRTLASEYASVYYVDNSDRIMVPYTIYPRTEEDFGELLRQGMDYSRVLLLYAHEYVYENDKELFLRQTDLGHVLYELRNKKHYDIVCRRVLDGRLRYAKISYVKLEDTDKEATAFAVAFDYSTENVIRDFIGRKLTDEFDMVFYADLDRVQAYGYREGGKRLDEDSFIEYAEMCAAIAAKTEPGYRNMWNRFADVEYLRDYIGDSDQREYVYKVEAAENEWRRGVWQVVDRKNGVIQSAIFSSIVIDNFTADQMRLNTEMTDALVSGFSSVYAVDLDTDRILYYDVDDLVAGTYAEMLESGVGYTQILRYNIDHFVADADLDRLEKLCDLKYLRERFEEHSSFTETYLGTITGESTYRDMRYIKLEDDLGGERFLWAFADADERIRTDLLRENELREKNEELARMNEDVVELLGNIVEGRDLESGLHVRRVKRFTNILARTVKDMIPEYGLTEEMIGLISSASALHDVGKIMIPDAVLLKPGKLTEEEYDLMKTHCIRGCELLEKAPKDWSDAYLKTSMEICRWHHEKYDGSGYPDALVGDAIPISAQIVGIADCFDALVTERIYKPAYSVETAYRMIQNGDCGVFSGKLLDCFTACRDQFFEEVERSIIEL